MDDATDPLSAPARLEFLSSVGGVFCPAEQACLGEASLPPQRQWSSAADGCDAVGGY
jgi:hypothetical protein